MFVTFYSINVKVDKKFITSNLTEKKCSAFTVYFNLIKIQIRGNIVWSTIQNRTSNRSKVQKCLELHQYIMYLPQVLTQACIRACGWSYRWQISSCDKVPQTICTCINCAGIVAGLRVWVRCPILSQKCSMGERSRDFACQGSCQTLTKNILNSSSSIWQTLSYWNSTSPSCWRNDSKVYWKWYRCSGHCINYPAQTPKMGRIYSLLHLTPWCQELGLYVLGQIHSGRLCL